jgi:signal transduction histidine kinase
VTGEPRPISAQIDFTLYRAAQEALTNVRKHARAERVDVALHFEPERIRLEVCDDGRGQGDSSGGFGLMGLRERVHLHGGSVTAQAAPGESPGKGFRLEVEIPV